MKIASRSIIFSLMLASSAVAAPLQMQTAYAQEATPADARIFVDLRDASLYDAADMVFRAAGITNYKIDDSGRNVTVGKASFTNRRWDDVVRVLANDNGYRLRNIGGTYTIDRKPVANNGFPGMMPGGAMGTYPGMMPGGFPGMMPGGVNPAGNIMTFGGRKMSMETRPSPQILPGGRQGSQNGRAPASSEFRLRTLQHVYAGGIVRLFENASVLTTREFLVPEAALTEDIGGSLTTPGDGNNSSNGSSGGSGSGGFGGSSGSGGGFGGSTN